jgi:hypothetical protein
MDKYKLWLKIYFGNLPIAYGKFYEHFAPLIKKFGIAKKDYCEYRLTQMFDQNNQPTEDFYYSNKSLEFTTYKQTTMKEFTSLYNLEFVCRENNNGIFKKHTKTKILRYLGKSKIIVNSPYMIKINFGDFIAISNDLLMIIPRKDKKKLFK